MKKIFSFLLISLSAFLLSSCIDYVQSVSYRNGKYELYYKCTVSKAILALADEDADEIFNDDTLSDLPSNVSANKIDNEYETGFEIKASVSPDTKDESEQDLLPLSVGNQIKIPFLLGKDDTSITESLSSGDEDTKTYTQAFLSSAKARILVSKKIIPSMSTAYFSAKNRNDSDYEIPFYDYGDNWAIEVPFPVLAETTWNYDYICLIK